MGAAASLGQFAYQCHKPKETAVYKIVQENLEKLFAMVREGIASHLRKKAGLAKLHAKAGAVTLI